MCFKDLLGPNVEQLVHAWLTDVAYTSVQSKQRCSTSTTLSGIPAENPNSELLNSVSLNTEIERNTDCPDATSTADLPESTNEAQLSAVNLTASGCKRKSEDTEDQIKRQKLFKTDNVQLRTLPCTTAGCEQKFANVGNRNRHLSSACKTLHRELNTVVDRKYRCSVCGFGFHQKTCLARHQAKGIRCQKNIRK
jgi:hypothetical protein